MDRWACISIPALPLQILLRQRSELSNCPSAVVSEDKPQGVVLFMNERARACGVLIGQSYAVALSLASGLRAYVMSDAELADAISGIKTLLWNFSPHVEVANDAGVFWLDASGLGQLYPELARWAHALRDMLAAQQLVASVIVGFSRFGTYAVARSSHTTLVFERATEERERSGKVPLAYLDVEPALRDVLAKLGVHRVSEFLNLPSNDLLSRFGKAAERLHRLASGEAFAPLCESPFIEPLEQRALLDEPETDVTRLLFVIKRLLDGLLQKLVARGQALLGLSFECKLDRGCGLLGPELLRPAVPSLDVLALLDLVRLRLEARDLAAGIIEVHVEATGVQTSAEQLRVFAEQPRRDLAAGNRALARLRADLGDEAVVQAVVCPGHLPEAMFEWRLLAELSVPKPPPSLSTGATGVLVPIFSAASRSSVADEKSAQASLARRPLVRRIFTRSEALQAARRDVRNDGWLIRGLSSGAVTHSAGPYSVSGGWWLREAHREYQYVLTQRGDLLWVYYDKKRRRYFLHGEVQ